MAFLTFLSSLLEEMSSKPTYCIFIACTNTVLNKHWVSFRRCHIKKRIIIPVCRVSLLRLLVSSVTVRNVHSEKHEIAGREGGRGGEERKECSLINMNGFFPRILHRWILNDAKIK